MPNSFGVSILGGSVRRKDSRQNNCNIPKLLDISVQEIMVPIALLWPAWAQQGRNRAGSCLADLVPWSLHVVWHCFNGLAEEIRRQESQWPQATESAATAAIGAKSSMAGCSEITGRWNWRMEAKASICNFDEDDFGCFAGVFDTKWQNDHSFCCLILFGRHGRARRLSCF